LNKLKRFKVCYSHRRAKVRTSDDRDASQIEDLRTHPQPYVTASQLARYWRVSRKVIHKQIEMGILHGFRLGPRLVRIRTVDAIRFEHVAKASTHAER
jgi:hypothetical protein